jgi:hypothetical protein
VAALSKNNLKRLFKNSDLALTSNEKGTAFEKLACYIFKKIPGIEITYVDKVNKFQSEELDIALWNNRDKRGLSFLPNIILVECKNWNIPINSKEIVHFASKLKKRACEYGILIASQGITGSANTPSSGYKDIADALADERRIIIITRGDIENLNSSEDFIKIIKIRLTGLVASGTFSI